MYVCFVKFAFSSRSARWTATARHLPHWV